MECSILRGPRVYRWIVNGRCVMLTDPYALYRKIIDKFEPLNERATLKQITVASESAPFAFNVNSLHARVALERTSKCPVQGLRLPLHSEAAAGARGRARAPSARR